MEIVDFEYHKHADGVDIIFKSQPDLGIPSLKNVVDNAIIEEDGEVIAYGVIKLYAEGVLILNRSLPKRERAEAVILMLSKALKVAKKSGLEQLYVTSTDDGYTEVLKNRFGFKEVPGKTLFVE